MKYFWKASMVYSTISTETSKHPENKVSGQSKKLMNARALTWDFCFPWTTRPIARQKFVLMCQRASGRSWSSRSRVLSHWTELRHQVTGLHQNGLLIHTGKWNNWIQTQISLQSASLIQLENKQDSCIMLHVPYCNTQWPKRIIKTTQIFLS